VAIQWFIKMYMLVYCVDGSICHLKFSKVVLAYILGEVGTFLHVFVKCFFQDMPTNFYWSWFIFDRHRAKNKLARFVETQCKIREIEWMWRWLYQASRRWEHTTPADTSTMSAPSTSRCTDNSDDDDDDDDDVWRRSSTDLSALSTLSWSSYVRYVPPYNVWQTDRHRLREQLRETMKPTWWCVVVCRRAVMTSSASSRDMASLTSLSVDMSDDDW